MEETRQYSALTAEQRRFATIHLLGSVILVASLIAQMFYRIDALFPAIMGVGISRIGLAAWQLARPACSSTERTESGLVFNIVAWGSTLLLLLWLRFR